MSNNLERLYRLRNDCYVVIVIFVVLTALIVIAIVYLIKHLMAVVKNYEKNKGLRENVGDSAATGQSSIDPNIDTQNPRDASADDEVYDENADNTKMSSIPQLQPDEYMEQSKQNFYKDMDKIYNDYNLQKSTYIANTYDGRENDDIVDKKVLYPDYDDYDYTIK
jgi:hypothetical protein